MGLWKTFVSKGGYVSALVGLLVLAYQGLNAWATFDFVFEERPWRWADDVLNPWAGVALLAVGFLWLAAQTPTAERMLSRSSLGVRAISGEGFALLLESETDAQLAIRNGGRKVVTKGAVGLHGIH